MIVRTPPPSKKQRLESRAADGSPPVGSDRQLVVYEDPPDRDPDLPSSSSDHLLCTYQCRQMVPPSLSPSLLSSSLTALLDSWLSLFFLFHRLNRSSSTPWAVRRSKPAIIIPSCRLWTTTSSKLVLPHPFVSPLGLFIYFLFIRPPLVPRKKQICPNSLLDCGLILETSLRCLTLGEMIRSLRTLNPPIPAFSLSVTYILVFQCIGILTCS